MAVYRKGGSGKQMSEVSKNGDMNPFGAGFFLLDEGAKDCMR